MELRFHVAVCPFELISPWLTLLFGEIKSEMSDRIAVGLIGYGLGGSVFHAPLVVSEPRLRLKSVVTSRSGEIARDLPTTAAVSDPKEIFDDPEIKLVVITTPNQTHFSLARQALEAGKHVVIDKPFTTSLAETDTLIALAKQRGLILSVFQNRRWDGDFLTICQLVRQQTLGNVSYFESRFNRFRPTIRPGWREEIGPGTGLLYDLGPHLVDQALVLFGVPNAIFADVAHLRSQGTADDYFHIILEYDRLRAILHASNLVYHPGPRFVLHSDRGSYVKFELDPQEQNLKDGIRPGMQSWGLAEPKSNGTLYLADESERQVPTLPGAYERYYAEIAGAILTGAEPPVTAKQGRDVMFVLEAAFRSAREKRSITLR